MTTDEVNPNRVLQCALVQPMKRVIVIGVTMEGKFYAAASHPEFVASDVDEFDRRFTYDDWE